MNAIYAIKPFYHNGVWMFTDKSVGLENEPFVSGADDILDVITREIPGARKGFTLIFSKTPFPGHQYYFRWLRHEVDGDWYRSDALDMEGWLCPALRCYFPEAPQDLYVSLKSIAAAADADETANQPEAAAADEVVCIVDRSGSMSAVQAEALEGLNEFIRSQAALEAPGKLSLALFNTEVELTIDRQDRASVAGLTFEQYVTQGGTALMDAIGETLTRLRDVRAKEGATGKVVVAILTDGEENSSREYSGAAVRSLITRCEKELGWEFVFLAANQDVALAAEGLGIRKDRAYEFLATKAGTKRAFTFMADLVKEPRGTK